MDVKINGPPKPVLTPLGSTWITCEKKPRSQQIAMLIERNAYLKEKIKENEILIREMKKEFKALYFEKWEDYVKRNNQDTK